MKKTKTVVLASLLATAFSASPAFAADDALTVVKAYMKTWSSLAEKRGVTDMDINATANQAAMFFDADGIYLDSTVGTPQQGIIVARDNVIKPFLNSFPNARWEMVGDPKVSGNDVEFKWLFSGNAYGPSILDATCPGKGDRLALQGNSKITVTNGLITYQNDSYNDKDIPAQLTRTVAACATQKETEAKTAAAAQGLAITGNFMLTNNYLFRGITVTQGKPAVQGGIDMVHPSGFYLSLWGSNVAEAAYNNGGGTEFDLYVGNKWDIGGGMNIDTGFATYQYPGASYTSFTGDGSTIKYNTSELKLGWNYDIYNANLWYGLNKYWAGFDFDNNFAKTKTNGTSYLEVNANPIIAEGVTLNLHAGHQTVKNSSNASFNDYKIGVTADAGFMNMPGWNFSAAVWHNSGDKHIWAYADADSRHSANPNWESAVGTSLVISIGKYF